MKSQSIIENLFNTYISTTDLPILFESEESSNLSPKAYSKILYSEDTLEQALNEGLRPVIEKKLAINPFLDEDLRNEIFEMKSKSSANDFISEICRESYFQRNIQSTLKLILIKTDSLINWKRIKSEALAKIYSEFSKNNLEFTEESIRLQINKKINN